MDYFTTTPLALPDDKRAQAAALLASISIAIQTYPSVMYMDLVNSRDVLYILNLIKEIEL